MTTERRIAKYVLIAACSIVLYLLIFGFIDNGLKNQQLAGRELPLGWHAVKSTVGLCVGYVPQYSAFPFATQRNVSDYGCGREDNSLASLVNFLAVLVISVFVSLGLAKAGQYFIGKVRHE